MVKMNLSNNQTAFEYALYMIASSYFDKVTCKSKFNERKMLIQYKEQKKDNQYMMEEICIKYMDGLAGKLPKDFFNLNTEVQLRRHYGQNLTEIIFKNERYIICFVARYAGKQTHIDQTIWVRKAN